MTASLDLDALEAVAREAKKDGHSVQWSVSAPFIRGGDGPARELCDVLMSRHPRATVAENCRSDIAAHIAAASPDVVLALIARVRAAEAIGCPRAECAIRGRCTRVREACLGRAALEEAVATEGAAFAEVDLAAPLDGAATTADHDTGDEDRRPILLGPWCENCGDAFDGPERPCPQPSPGRPLYECGRGGHMFRSKTEPAS